MVLRGEGDRQNITKPALHPTHHFDCKGFFTPANRRVPDVQDFNYSADVRLVDTAIAVHPDRNWLSILNTLRTLGFMVLLARVGPVGGVP